jgi:hypothetical protein
MLEAEISFKSNVIALAEEAKLTKSNEVHPLKMSVQRIEQTSYEITCDHALTVLLDVTAS